MNVERRMMMVRLIEKMNADGAYSQKLELENVSRMHGKIINTEVSGFEDLACVEKNGRKGIC